MKLVWCLAGVFKVHTENCMKYAPLLRMTFDRTQPIEWIPKLHQDDRWNIDDFNNEMFKKACESIVRLWVVSRWWVIFGQIWGSRCLFRDGAYKKACEIFSYENSFSYNVSTHKIKFLIRKRGDVRAMYGLFGYSWQLKGTTYQVLATVTRITYLILYSQKIMEI